MTSVIDVFQNLLCVRATCLPQILSVGGNYFEKPFPSQSFICSIRLEGSRREISEIHPFSFLLVFHDILKVELINNCKVNYRLVIFTNWFLFLDIWWFKGSNFHAVLATKQLSSYPSYIFPQTEFFYSSCLERELLRQQAKEHGTDHGRSDAWLMRVNVVPLAASNSCCFRGNVPFILEKHTQFYMMSWEGIGILIVYTLHAEAWDLINLILTCPVTDIINGQKAICMGLKWLPVVTDSPGWLYAV